MIPIISATLIFIKNDCFDMDCQEMSKRLNITPTNFWPARISPGKLLINDRNIDEYRLHPQFEEGLTLVAPICEGRFMIHSSWSYRTEEIRSWEIADALEMLESVFAGKEETVKNACAELHLSAKVIVDIQTEAPDLPEITLSAQSIAFWSRFALPIAVQCRAPA